MSVTSRFSSILTKYRPPVVGVKKRVLTQHEVRWLSLFIAFIVVLSIMILFVDDITFNSMLLEGEHYWLTPSPMSKASLMVIALLLVLASPRLLPLLVYQDDGKLSVKFYRSKTRYDDTYVFTMWNGDRVMVHEDLVFKKSPLLYVLIGPYRAYYQGDLIIEETPDFEITQRIDLNKKLEILEEQVSYWKTRALLSEAQLEEARRLTPTIISKGGGSNE